MRQATGQIPVVFIATSDPVGLGFVESLAHPGGNLTGFMLYEVSVAGKLWSCSRRWRHSLQGWRYSSTRKISARRVTGGRSRLLRKSLGVVPVWLPVRNAADIENAVDTLVREPSGGLVLPTDVTTIVHRDLIVALAARHRLPAIYSFRADVASGGLMCYGAGYRRSVPSRVLLCRSHSQRREAGRSAGAGADQVRAGDQPQDRQGARPRRAGDRARPRRRGDRVSAPAASWCDPAGASPAQVRGSVRLVASVACPLATAVAKRTQQLHGVWD